MSFVLPFSKKSFWCEVESASHDVPLRKQESIEFSEAIVNSPEGRRLIKQFKRAVAFQAKFENGKAYLNVDNQRDPSSRQLIWNEIKDVSLITPKAARFLELAKKCDEVFKKTHESRCAENAVPRSCLSKGLEAGAITGDLLSAASNSLSVVKETMSAAALAGTKIAVTLPALGIVRGALAAGLGACLVKNGGERAVQSYSLGDHEGVVLGTSDVVTGASLAGLGVGMLAMDGATLAPLVISPIVHALPIAPQLVAPVTSAAVFPLKAASLAIAPAMNIFAFIMYGILAVYGTYGIVINLRFRNQFKKLAKGDNEQLCSDLIRLKNQVRGADSDKELKKMWNKFSRRTSAECCEMVRETLTPDFLARLEAALSPKETGKTQTAEDAEVIRKATELVAKVKIANGRQLVKHSLFILIAVLGILAVIASIQFTGPLAAALFVAGALLWLVVDSTVIQRVAAKTFYPDLGCSKKDVWKSEWAGLVRSAKKISEYFNSCIVL